VTLLLLTAWGPSLLHEAGELHGAPPHCMGPVLAEWRPSSSLHEASELRRDARGLRPHTQVAARANVPHRLVQCDELV